MLRASVVERILIAGASTTLALCIGLVIVALSGYDPVQFLVSMIDGSVGGQSEIARTLRFSTLFILTGISVAVAFRAGVFNIGVQGQFIVGGFSTIMVIIWTAPFLPEGTVGGILLLLIGFAVGGLAAGAYAVLPGVLKAYADANEIITTIMLNFIATGVVGWLVQNPLRGEGNTAPNTERIPEYVTFPKLLFDSPGFSIIGLGIALVVVVGIYVIMERSRFGYDMVTSGHQESAATYSGVDAKRNIVSTMALSGIVAGIAGAVFAIMIQGYYTDPGGIGTYGFDAIAVSLLAANNPLSVIPAGLLFGGLDSAATHIGIYTDVPVQVINGVIGLVILFVAVPELFRMAAQRTGLGGDGQ